MGYFVKKEFIKERRLALSMNQRMLADKAKISGGYVSIIESGRVKSVGLKTLLKIANALNVHYNTLIVAEDAKLKPFYVTIPIDNHKTIEVGLIVETAPQYDEYRSKIQRAIRDVINAHDELIVKTAIPTPQDIPEVAKEETEKARKEVASAVQQTEMVWQ